MINQRSLNRKKFVLCSLARTGLGKDGEEITKYIKLWRVIPRKATARSPTITFNLSLLLLFLKKKLNDEIIDRN